MKSKMILIGAVVMLMISVTTFAQSADEFVVPLSDPAKRGKLKAHLNYGSITVKGTARKDVLVRYKAVEKNEDDHDHDHDRDNEEDDDRDSKPKSKAGLKKIGGGGMDLEVFESNNSVRVHSESWNNRLNLEIEIPSGMDVDLHTYNGGDLMITNIQGQLELTNYNGEITALNISGSVVATTYNGEIKVTFDKVTENTPMSFSTYNGDIDLSFPATLKAALKMKTEQGEIYTDFDINVIAGNPVVKTEDKKNGTYRVKIDDWKRANVNGGGPEFAMKNYNGDIFIRRK